MNRRNCHERLRALIHGEVTVFPSLSTSARDDPDGRTRSPGGHVPARGDPAESEPGSPRGPRPPPAHPKARTASFRPHLPQQSSPNAVHCPSQPPYRIHVQEREKLTRWFSSAGDDQPGEARNGRRHFETDGDPAKAGDTG